MNYIIQDLQYHVSFNVHMAEDWSLRALCKFEDLERELAIVTAERDEKIAVQLDRKFLTTKEH